MINALTIDLEEYFQVSKLEHVIERNKWGDLPSRVRSNTIRILELFDEYGCKATFFTVGWVAERYPHLIREIARTGHEIACHSYWHRRISDMTPAEFREDLRRSKRVLEDLSGKAVLAFRAPTYSIIKSSEWAWDILIEEGFQIDSSVFPNHHNGCGNLNAHRFIHTIHREAGSLIEFPPSTLQIAGKHIPILAGGYFRLFPYRVTSYGIKRLNNCENKPAVISFHPWELDPNHPMPRINRFAEIRHKVNIDTTESKLRRVLSEFQFGTVEDVVKHHLIDEAHCCV